MYFKVAICDDDASMREFLSSEVKEWAAGSGHTVAVSDFPSAEAFLFEFSENKSYEVLLLDIEMPGMNGMELARKLRSENAMLQIIFVTGYSDYISEGYDVSALHYLMKPVSREKLFEVLSRAANKCECSVKKLKVSFDRETKLIPVSDIMYVEAQKQYVTIHSINGTYKMKCSLSDIESQLDEYFKKCQRSFVVNLSYVTRIKNDSVTLKNGESVPISRGMASVIKDEIIRLF